MQSKVDRALLQGAVWIQQSKKATGKATKATDPHKRVKYGWNGFQGSKI
jgi:hypothetical protein